MQLILTHIGEDLPEYIECCLKQIRLFNKKMGITLLLNGKYISINKSLTTDYNVELVDYTQFDNHSLIKDFVRLSWFDSFGTPNTVYKSQPLFFRRALERLFYLAAYCQEHNMYNVFHMENDVLLYSDIADIYENIDKSIEQLIVTPVCETHASFAFSYISSSTPIVDFCSFVIDAMFNIKEYGNKWLIKQSPQVDMINDMTLLQLYKNANYFPVLPIGEDFERYGIIFDGASWGQYLGGTNNSTNSIGFTDSRHFVGRAIRGGDYTITFNAIPVVTNAKTNQTFKLHNLHVHSKRLEKFTSYEIL